jgi:hypothetical protein
MAAEQYTLFEAPAAGEYEIPQGVPVENCRSCGAAIVWGKTKTGAAVPLNTDRTRIIDGKRYALTHFATCPQGREWRRER